VGENPIAAGLDDLDGDGVLDIAVALHGCSCWPDNEASLAVLLGKGAGDFSEPVIYRCGHYANDLVILDIDADGAKDILVAANDPLDSTGALFFAGKGDGTYLPGEKFSLPEVWRILRADVDGDGVEELVFYASQVAYCEASLEGLAHPRIVDLGLDDPYAYLGTLTVADANRDGVPDVLLAKGYSYDRPCDEVLVYRGLGGGEFSEPTAVLSGNGTTDIHMGPVDPGGEPVAVLSGSLYEHATNFLVAIPSSVFEASAEFIRADANGDGNVDLSDAVATLMYLFMGGVAHCRDASDANDDGILNMTDPIFVLHFLFLGGSAPPWPFPDQGWDSTDDTLGCARYPA
jgi:hypothetical protein